MSVKSLTKPGRQLPVFSSLMSWILWVWRVVPLKVMLEVLETVS